ncbi:MAG: prepilin-type N-terminal cleavage/methylation domain-containing protein [Candidatus Pacebacteria bacterium]|nr:prepilin-type N-terminal cleavage/methylation domain-containing protein [Candidatus Paceibacterota bacterium]
MQIQNSNYKNKFSIKASSDNSAWPPPQPMVGVGDGTASPHTNHRLVVTGLLGSHKSFTLVELMTPNNQPKVGVGLPAGKAGASSNSKKSFTLVELMIVIAILAILSAIVIFALNPSELFKKSRDSRRITDIQTLYKGISFMES